MYSINGGPRSSNNTTSSIAAGSTDVKVTFYNKADPRTREITIQKFFVQLPDGYTPTSADYPTFIFNPVPAGFDFDEDCTVDTSGLPGKVKWTCTVPADWDGTITEALPLPDGWEQVECNFESQTAEHQSTWSFCNVPFGTVIVNKLNSSASGPNFTATISGLPATDISGGSLDSSPSIAQGSPSSQTLVPLGSQVYNVTEVNAGTVETCGSGATDYFTIVQAPADKVLDTPGEIQTWTIVNQPCGVLGQGGLVLEKFRDNNGDGTANGSDAHEPWTFKVTGPNGYDETFVVAANEMPKLIGDLEPGDYTVTELTAAGWKVIGLRVDNGALAAAATQATVAVDGASNVLRGVSFYNQPRVNIEVNKTEISSTTPAGAPGAGWSFTLTGCGVGPLVKVTAATGQATFSDLPPAVGCSYTVTETQQGGWSSLNPVQVTAPTAPGQATVLNFTNVKIEVCVTGCFTTTIETPTPPATPVTRRRLNREDPTQPRRPLPPKRKGRPKRRTTAAKRRLARARRQSPRTR